MKGGGEGGGMLVMEIGFERGRGGWGMLVMEIGFERGRGGWGYVGNGDGV